MGLPLVTREQQNWHFFPISVMWCIVHSDRFSQIMQIFIRAMARTEQVFKFQPCDRGCGAWSQRQWFKPDVFTSVILQYVSRYVLWSPQAFEISVPVDGGKGSNKKISFTNPYSSSRVFNLRTDRPDLLQFKEEQFQVRKPKANSSSINRSQTLSGGSAV